MRSLLQFLLCGLLFTDALTNASQAAILRVGAATDTGCTHNSLESALLAAEANGDFNNTIRLTNSRTYTNVHAAISTAKQLRIEGAYDNCADPDQLAGGNTPVSGIGSSGSVMTFNITGSVQATLDSLFVSNGTNDFGGGIQLLSGGLLLDQTRVENNTARFGAGIFVRGGGAQPSVLTITNDSVIRANHTYSAALPDSFGGGIFCEQAGRINFTDGFVVENSAFRGGGIHLVGGCRLYFSGISNANEVYIRNNLAQNVGPEVAYGGGVFASARAKISSNNLARIFIDGNQSYNGAAITLIGDNTAPSTDQTSFDAQHVWIKGNSASNITGGILLIDKSTFALTGSSPFVRCGNEYCTQISNNTGGGVRADWLTSNPDHRPSIRLDRVMMNGNTAAVAGSAIRTNGHLEVLSSIITNHGGSAVMSLIGTAAATQGEIFYTSIVGNNAASVFRDDALLTTLARTVNLTGSIVHNTVPVNAATSGFPLAFNASNTCPPLVNENTTIGGLGNVSASTGLDADFIPITTGAAVDWCAVDVNFATDINGNPRPVDVALGNVFGPQDLGGIEAQAAILPDLLFANGFE